MLDYCRMKHSEFTYSTAGYHSLVNHKTLHLEAKYHRKANVQRKILSPFLCLLPIMSAEVLGTELGPG